MAIGKTVLTVIVIVVVIAAGFGGYAVSTYVGHPTTTATTGTGGINQTLVALAQKEGGTVTCYCVMDTGDWPTFNAILTKEFPWIKVNYVGLAPGDIVSRAKTEFQAGHVQADILVDSQPALETLIPVGALRPWYSAEEAFNNFSGTDPANIIHPVFGLPVGLCWNTNLITNNNTLPTSYSGLANSAWKGKIAIDDPSTLNLAGPLFATFGGSTTNQSFITWLNALKANSPILAASAGDVYTDVSTGQVPLGLCYLNDYAGGIGKAPVGFKYLTSTVYVSPVPAALTANAPHPYTAELLLEWLQSYSGAVGFALTGRPPVFGPVASQYFPSIPRGSALVAMAGNTNMYTNGTQWTNFYTGIFGP